MSFQGVCQNSSSVIILNVEANKPFVSQGFPMNFTATVSNNGTVEESFNLTLYANAEVVGRKVVTLLSHENETVTFVWDADVGRGD